MKKLIASQLIAVAAVIGACATVAACQKKDDALGSDTSTYSNMPSASEDGTAPSEVTNSQLPGMAPAYSASSVS